jgi:predicted amidophosphoribosyltransferase
VNIYTCSKCRKFVQSLKGLCPICGEPSPKERPMYKMSEVSSQPYIHWLDGDCLENPKSHKHPDWIEQWEIAERKYYKP